VSVCRSRLCADRADRFVLDTVASRATYCVCVFVSVMENFVCLLGGRRFVLSVCFTVVCSIRRVFLLDCVVLDVVFVLCHDRYYHVCVCLCLHSQTCSP
jgi:hypothetical protein